jgi:hypothetical protein
VNRLILLVAIALLLSFQNCAKSIFEGQSSSTGVDILRGNGESYSGITFEHKLASGTCADGSIVESSILALPQQRFYLTRKNCLHREQKHPRFTVTTIETAEKGCRDSTGTRTKNIGPAHLLL